MFQHASITSLSWRVFSVSSENQRKRDFVLRRGAQKKTLNKTTNLNLCDLLEKLNRHSEGLTVILNAKEKVIDKVSDILLSEALFLYRQKKYDILQKLIIEINIDKLEKKRKPTYLNLKANLHHHLKEFSAAFKTFKVMNETIKKNPVFKNQRADEYLNEQRDRVFQLECMEENFLGL